MSYFVHVTKIFQATPQPPIQFDFIYCVLALIAVYHLCDTHMNCVVQGNMFFNLFLLR